MLSESDAKVLRAISEGHSDPLTIAEKLEMKVEAVRASADALAEEGLVKVIKSVNEAFSLTEEGGRYAREGLPERRLLNSIGSGTPMSELKDPSLKIGLGWLRKKGWAAIQMLSSSQQSVIKCCAIMLPTISDLVVRKFARGTLPLGVLIQQEESMLKKMTFIVTMLVMASMVLTAFGGSPTLAPAPTQAPTQPPAKSPTQAPTPKPTEPPAQPAAGKSALQLTGTVWKWTTSLFNDDTRKTPDDPNKYLLEFLPQGQVSIKADCNRVSGTYTTDENKLTITPGAGTLAACPPGSMGDEYIRQLTTVSSYLFNYGNLILEFKLDSGRPRARSPPAACRRP